MTTTEMFVWGFSGSVAVDIVTAAQFFNAQHVVFPVRYTRFWFYIIRLLLAIVAGGLAVAYEIDKAILAANIGAATPLIIQAFAQGLGSGSSSVPVQNTVTTTSPPVSES